MGSRKIMRAWTLLLLGVIVAVLVTVPARHELRIAKAIQPVASALSRLENPVAAPVMAMSVAPIESYSPLTIKPPPYRPLEGTKIVIDPGHGGQSEMTMAYTGGTVGAATGQTESDVNLRVSLFLRHYLEMAGATVLMTRTVDTRVSTSSEKMEELDYRSALANSSDADLFVSVHHNMSPNPATNFTAVFFPPEIPNSASLAENISGAVGAYLKTSSIGAKPGDYRVLNRISIPGVIVEASFMSNPAEDLKLASLDYNKTEAKGIATGILNYLRATRGLEVDFDRFFEPDMSGSPRAIADATLVGHHIVERKSLFGTSYAEVTYDAMGRVVEWRELGPQRLVGASRGPTKRTEPVKPSENARSEPEPVGLKRSPSPTRRTAETGEPTSRPARTVPKQG